MPDDNIEPVSPVVVPPAEPVGGVLDEGSHVNQPDELDVRRQTSPDADGNPTSGRDDCPERRDDDAPASDGTGGKPQVDPPEYRSFGDFKTTGHGLAARVGPQQVRTRICASFEVIGRARDPHGNERHDWTRNRSSS
jgi:hypothetical protein